MLQTPVGLVLEGGFKNLPSHVGALTIYQEIEKKGYLPHPAFGIGSSAGAIAMTAMSPWTEKNTRMVCEEIINLKKSDIYDQWRLMKIIAGLNLLGSVAGFAQLLLPQNTPRWQRAAIESGRALLSLGTEYAFVDQLLHEPSLFSNEPLRRFLRKKLYFEGIWNSDIKMEIPAVDIHTREEYIFSLAGNKDRPDRDQRLVEVILASASVPGHFPLIHLDGHWLDDAAILNNIPIHRAVAADCRTIFVFCYSHDAAPPLTLTWIEELSQALDIAIHENTKKILQENLGPLHTVIPVFSQRPIPNQYFSKFDRETMAQAVNLGAQAMLDTLQKHHII